MSSVLKSTAAPVGGAPMPFASYAKIVRMLVPPAERISFYDDRCEALWINDGVEEPDFRLHVELSIARARQARPSVVDRSAPATSGEHTDHPRFVFAIRNPQGMVVGALGLECRDLPAGARYRSADAVERILMPLLEIMGHAWPAIDRPATPASASRDSGTRQAATAAAQLPQSMPVPALLRKSLLLATELIDCAFGAIVLPDRPFTLSQRVSPDESDLAINSAIDTVRAHVLRWLQVRDEPLVVNTAATSRSPQQLPYKLLALPVRDSSKRVVALLMLFRNARSRDFVGVDVDELAQIAARIPAEAVASLAPPKVTKPAPATAAPVVKSASVAAPGLKAATPPKAGAPVVAAAAPAPEPPVLTSEPARAKPAVRAPAPAISAAVASPAATLSMDARVRAALRDSTFDLYAQPISALREPGQSRFEVLLRMREGTQLHTPAIFLNAAENSRLLPELDCWVIGALLKTLRKRAVTVRTSGLEFSINIAGQSLATEQFSEFIVAEVLRSAIPASLLVFEISERTALEHEDAMEQLSARLRDVGCRIALDNCRSGLGTLDPLNKWPVSRVKIDGSLIRNIAISQRSASQVRAVAQIAAERGIETVAEGVEDQYVQDRLLDMGIDYAQGFHLGRPAPLMTLFG
jgi:EAL domain-containing protein (putative c-di-GMP-specific phosphodiesterase class I)